MLSLPWQRTKYLMDLMFSILAIITGGVSLWFAINSHDFNLVHAWISGALITLGWYSRPQ